MRIATGMVCSACVRRVARETGVPGRRAGRACQAGVSAHRLVPFGYCFELTDKAIAPGIGLKAFDYCFELT